MRSRVGNGFPGLASDAQTAPARVALDAAATLEDPFLARGRKKDSRTFRIKQQLNPKGAYFFKNLFSFKLFISKYFHQLSVFMRLLER